MVKNKYFFKDITNERFMFEPIDGCSVGCKYCNAYNGALQLGLVKNWQEWMIPKIKTIDEELFGNELKHVIDNKEMLKDFIFCGGTSDAFCNENSTISIIKGIKIINKSELRTRVLTKCKIPNLYKNLNPKLNQIGITITNLEMYSCHFLNGNIKTLQILKNKGFFVFLSLQPFNLNSRLWDLSLGILPKLCFVDQITFGILDKYHPNTHPNQYKKAYLFSDYITSFCEKREINFLNGAKYFCSANKRRLKNLGITEPMRYRDERGNKL